MTETVIVVLVVALFLVIMIFEEKKAADWYKKWPPIDDDEFMRRCKPGTNREIALKVRRIVARQLGIEYERVYPEQNFVNDLFCN